MLKYKILEFQVRFRYENQSVELPRANLSSDIRIHTKTMGIVLDRYSVNRPIKRRDGVLHAGTLKRKTMLCNRRLFFEFHAKKNGHT
jgi:hypothetical protein